MKAPPFWCTAPFSRALAGAFSAGTFAASPSADACSCRKCSACSAAMQPTTYKCPLSADVAVLSQWVSIAEHDKLCGWAAKKAGLDQERLY